MTEYYVPAGISETELVEKRSRFLGHVFPAATEEEARACIEAVKKSTTTPGTTAGASACIPARSVIPTTESPRARRDSPCSTYSRGSGWRMCAVW